MSTEHLARSRLREMIASAVKAPSSHNTQPWRFVVGDDEVLVFADRTRRLPVNDPDDRELTISCAAAAFTLAIAARHAGLTPTVERLPDIQGPDLLYRISLSPGDTTSDADTLYRAIDARHTTRAGFTDERLPALVDAMRKAAGANGATLEAIDEPRRGRLAELVAEGDRTQWADRQWRSEVAAWMRTSSGGDGLAVPTSIAPVVRTVVAHVDLGRRTARRDQELAKTAPLLAILATEGDGTEDWLVAGEALQHVLLVAAADGVEAGFLNQPCQVAELRQRLRELCEGAGHPQVVLRLGHPAKPLAAAPRRPVDAVIGGS